MTCDSPYWVMPKAALEKVPVPCGRCPPCKLRRVNSWVFRLVQEDRVSLSSHFLTLTYDTTHVPISDNGFMTLQKKDYQDFMKRLRKLCPDAKIKYYAVGEYGSDNKRPHYHAIIFNCTDSSLYDKAWGLGTTFLGNVSTDSIAYVMKYIDKPHSYKHDRDDRQEEFPLMSKGLGGNYLSPQIINYHKSDLSRLYATNPGGYRIALPRYYRMKIYDDNEQRAQRHIIQSSVEQAAIKDEAEFSITYADSPDYSYEQYKESCRFGRHKHFYSQLKPRLL